MNKDLKVRNLKLFSKGQLNKIKGQIGDRDMDWIIDRKSGIIIINSGDNKVLNETDFRIELETVLSSWEALMMLKDKDIKSYNNYVLHDGDREFGKLRFERRQVTDLALY